MRVVTLIPWRAGKDERRLQLWDWTRPFLEELGWPVYEGDDGGEPFSRAGSANDASDRAGAWDVALIGDADTIQEIGAAHRAARWAYETGKAIVPWTTRHKLSAAGTTRCVQRGPEEFDRGWTDRHDRTSSKGGGATIIVSREAWDTVGGMDERFRGYGNEDLAFAAALETLVIEDGMPREPGTVWHLWHKTQPRVGTTAAATPANRHRWDIYRQAHWNKERMLKVVTR